MSEATWRSHPADGGFDGFDVEMNGVTVFMGYFVGATDSLPAQAHRPCPPFTDELADVVAQWFNNIADGETAATADTIEAAAEVIAREYGPCNDDANHDGRQARWAAEALADADLVKSPAEQAVIDASLAMYAQVEITESFGIQGPLHDSERVWGEAVRALNAERGQG